MGALLPTFSQLAPNQYSPQYVHPSWAQPAHSNFLPFFFLKIRSSGEFQSMLQSLPYISRMFFSLLLLLLISRGDF